MENDFKLGDLVKLKILVYDDVEQNDIGVVVKVEGEGYSAHYTVKWQKSTYDGACRKWWLELIL